MLQNKEWVSIMSRGYRRIIKRVAARALSIMMIGAMLIMCTAEPQEAAAESNVKPANSQVLDSLMSNRSYVVDALMLKARPEASWNDGTLSNNPHFLFSHNCYMYESLLDQIENDVRLAAMLKIYQVKSSWEDYPLETLLIVNGEINPFVKALKQFNTEFNDERVKALKDMYEAFGGKYPIDMTIAKIKEEAATEAYHDFWNGYSTVYLTSMQGKEGTTAYDDYKESLKKSDDDRDKRVLSILQDAEKTCSNDSAEIFQQMYNVVQTLVGVEKQLDGETIEGAKVYDVILNDIFSTDYIAGSGLSMGMDLASKEAFAHWSTIIKNESEMISFVKDIAELDRKSVV